MTLAVSQVLAQVRGNSVQDAPAKTENKKGASVELDPALKEVVQAFEDAKELAKFAEQQKALAEETLRTALGDAKVGTIDGDVVVTVNNGSNGRVDGKLLQDGWPEAYAATYKTKRYTYLKGHLEK